MTSAEKKCFGASKYENFLGDDTPLPPYKACAFGTHNNFSPPPPPHYLSTALQWDFCESTAEEVLLEWSYGRISST